MDKTAKVTLEQLIKKKLDKDGKRTATKEIYVKSLDGNITFNNPTDSTRVEYLEKIKSKSFVDLVEGQVKLIYDCCPILHSKELQESCGIEYPYDIVKAIFDIEEITEIGNKLYDFFDEKKKTEDENKIKN